VSKIKGKASYSAIHGQLRRNYGNASKCEHCNTLSSKRYEWALKKGRTYSKDKEDYLELCTKCHRIYDNLQEKLWTKRRQDKAPIIAEIQKLYSQGWRQKDLAIKFGYCRESIRLINNRKVWMINEQDEKTEEGGEPS
jgi:hypothetical protein